LNSRQGYTMQPIISIVGKSNSGKTTLLENLIIELKQRGYKVAVIKHADNILELDTVNKDSWRLSQAGSELSMISSAQKLAIFKNITPDFSPEELSHFIYWDYDLLLTEGFKTSNYPKIEVHRKEQGSDLVSPPEQLVAVVTDEPLKIEVPQFASDESNKIADIIETEILAQPKEDDINLVINNTYMPLSPSFRNLLARTLIAMTSAFRNIREIKSMHVSLRRKY